MASIDTTAVKNNCQQSVLHVLNMQDILKLHLPLIFHAIAFVHLEPFEHYHQDSRPFLNLHRLDSQSWLLTLRTKPKIVILKHFWFPFQTVIQLYFLHLVILPQNFVQDLLMEQQLEVKWCNFNHIFQNHVEWQWTP